eukprot:GFUD01019004.1.p1 GENE.GFUD01019004.1~~GFUD01019004.1.p1  ORF type:complete len:329 (+),score=105.43 GFUD01019004.1:41-1027(+)
MVLGRRFVLKHHFVGSPKPEDFDLVEEELPPLKDNEIQFRALFLSVDPYMRPYTARMTPPITMIGGAVGVVEKSKNPNFPVGCTIVHMAGWVERGVVNPDAKGVKKAVDMGSLSKSLLLGVCGMPGNTAYFGLKEICEAKSGDTVVVSGAAGAVGNLVGQIAKNMGCRVIGFAGTDEKCAWLKSIGFSEAFNYKKCGVAESLAKAAPDGVDCYFDNVGGEMSAAVMAAMNTRGRVAVCGAISHYNEVGGYSKVTDVLPLCVFKELKVEGFLVGRWADRWMEGVSAMAAMVMKGDIKVQETVMEGFEKMPQAFMGLFTGDNTGKMIVKA